jgi:uncharacterized protein
MADDNAFNYPAYIDAAMRGAVREILKQVEREGLPGVHHFFIALRTDYPGTMISESLRARYPKEITIVLQHQFWDLHVLQDHFTVTLSFNNVPEKLVVPFAALVGFADPSTKFGLQFHGGEDRPVISAPSAPVSMAATTVSAASEKKEEAAEPRAGAQIIALDAFRKK